MILVDSSVWIDYFEGITTPQTIDTIIATCCIQQGYTLLHSDRDFDVFARHLGIKVATQMS